MGQSWSLIRKRLETEYLCDSLKGRVSYFATRYRKSHDGMGRVSILIDKKEVYQSCFYDWQMKRQEAWQEINQSLGRNTSYKEAGEEMELQARNKGGFDQFSFYNAFYAYQNQSIERSIHSKDPLVRLFAILDRRLGKKRLQSIASSIHNQPEWLQPFYILRLEAEGFITKKP